MRYLLLALCALLACPAAALAASAPQVDYTSGGVARTGRLVYESDQVDVIARCATADCSTLTASTQDNVRPALVTPHATPTPTPTLTTTPSPSPTSTPTPPPAGGLSVIENKLATNGMPIQLRGVSYPGNEYACIQGWGIFDGPSDDVGVTAIQSWKANVVHLGLNEDCVLGINGVPPAYAGQNYMNAIKGYVDRLHAHGIFAEVALFWEAPGTQKAQGHAQVLDADHSADALRVIANTFKGDPRTIIGLDSEPHDISWSCWRDGGSSCSVGYAALGMQGALDAVRGTGATNVVAVPGIDWANNISQWLTWRPADPLGQLVAESHVYGDNTCGTTACLDAQQAPVAAQVPVLWGEVGEAADGGHCGSTSTAALIGWADAHGVSYEPWHWNTWNDCLDLVADQSTGAVKGSAYATWVHDHLVAVG